VALSPAEVAMIDRTVGLDLLQFHGDQGPEDLAPYGRRAVAVTRVRRDAPPAAADLAARLAAFPDAWGFLFDVHHPGWGGSGESFRWELLAGLGERRPLLVAGGITPANARAALAASGADGVDVASGVESAPGIKDLALLERLMEEVKHGKD
jgi:phosphoribosylanthranilate isomerase